MSKAAVIYWSQTGNTEQMANAIADGIREGGVECDLMNVADVSAADAAKYDKLALGCPAMGAEVLEESEFVSFRKWKALLRAKRSACSVPTAGATASGCATGYSAPMTRTPTFTPKRA